MFSSQELLGIGVGFNDVFPGIDKDHDLIDLTDNFIGYNKVEIADKAELQNTDGNANDPWEGSNVSDIGYFCKINMRTDNIEKNTQDQE